MNSQEWVMPDPAEHDEPDTETVGQLEGPNFTATVGNTGYQNDEGVLIAFEDITVVVSASSMSGRVHIQTYGASHVVHPAGLRSGRTDLGERRHYIELRET